MQKEKTFLEDVEMPATDVKQVFFTYPETSMEVEIFPIDFIERQSMLAACENKVQIPGFREKASNYDTKKLDRNTAERCIGEIRGATVGCLKKVMLISKAALRKKLGLADGVKITDDMPVHLTKADGIYLFTKNLQFKLWVDAKSNALDAYNAAQQEEDLGN